MYKSTDAGKTWNKIGLEGTTRIPKIIADPKSEYRNRRRNGGSTETQRGIFRTDNGGQSWTNVLHVDDDETGGRDLSSPLTRPT